MPYCTHKEYIHNYKTQQSAITDQAHVFLMYASQHAQWTTCTLQGVDTFFSSNAASFSFIPNVSLYSPAHPRVWGGLFF